MKVLCVIPAPGRAKTAPLQYLRVLAGKPLLAYTTEAALEARLPSKVLVNTDDREVAEFARTRGIEAVSHKSLQDLVSAYEQSDGTYDAVCVLDPACPFRGLQDIDCCLEMLGRTGADSVATVVPVPREFHPQTVYVQGEDGSLKSVAPPDPKTQAPAYRPDGSITAARRDVLRNGNGLFGARTVGFPVDAAQLVQLDQPEEWSRAERIARRGVHIATRARISPLKGPASNRLSDWHVPPPGAPEILVSAGARARAALSSSSNLPGAYLDPVRKQGTLRAQHSELAFAKHEALLPAERTIAAYECLDPISPALVFSKARAGQAPLVSRIEDPFRPHRELLPGAAKAEAPLTAWLAARRLRTTELEKSPEARKRENPGGSERRMVAAALEFTGPLGKAAHRVHSVKPTAPRIASLGPAPVGQALVRPLPHVPPAVVPFCAWRPSEPVSRKLRAREILVHAPEFRCEGRTLTRAAGRAIVDVEFAKAAPVANPAAQTIVFPHPVASAFPALVWNRARTNVPARLPAGWENFGRESDKTGFASIQSRVPGVVWPARTALQFSRRLEWKGKTSKPSRMDSLGATAFPVPAAGLPASRGSRTGLNVSQTKKLQMPPVRHGKAGEPVSPTAPGEFQPAGNPAETLSFRGAVKGALMPRGAFCYVEIEEREDPKTGQRAQGYAGEIRMPESRFFVRSTQTLGLVGHSPAPATSKMGESARRLALASIPQTPTVVRANAQLALAAMDFTALAGAAPPRWRLSLKKTAGIFT